MSFDLFNVIHFRIKFSWLFSKDLGKNKLFRSPFSFSPTNRNTRALQLSDSKAVYYSDLIKDLCFDIKNMTSDALTARNSKDAIQR